MTADVLLTNVKWANGDRAFLHAPGCPICRCPNRSSLAVNRIAGHRRS